jgi:TolB-like protein/tetratricopeptide (TPR) repeat protein
MHRKAEGVETSPVCSGMISATIRGIGSMATIQPMWTGDELSSEQIALVRYHLNQVLESQQFAGSKRAQDFLRLVVGHALQGQVDSLRERMIGAEMFGRPVDYDTGNDPVVRVKAGEVRKKLGQYYSESKNEHAVRIELPSGHYVPKFHFAVLATAAPPHVESAPPPPADLRPTQHDRKPDDRLTPEAVVAEVSRHYEKKLRRQPGILVGAALGLVVLAIAAYAGFEGLHKGAVTSPEIRSVAILPLQNLSGDPQQDYLADGITEELIADLGQVSTLRVISRTSAMSYKGTKKKLPEIARELAVEGVVEGSVMRQGNLVRITAELIDARTDHPIWSHTYIRDQSNVLALQGELAQAVANEVSINERPEQKARFARVRPVNTDAEDLYLQGMFRLNASDCQGAIGYFQKAIEADPNYAQAHAALANCYGSLGEGGVLAYKEAFSKQKADAAQAIELDDSLPDGHAELANASMNLDWDWGTAAKEFYRAQNLNPSAAAVHERYAVYLERTGKLSEAMAEAERGVELDPISARSFRNAGFTYYFCRQYDQALSMIRRAHALKINLPDEDFLLGDIYAEKGMFKESISEFRKMGDSPHAVGHLGNAYARAGRTNEANKVIAQLEEHLRKEGGMGMYEISLIYAGLGKKNEAFRWLEESYKTHNEGLTNLEIDPCLDPLRSDPRFNDLMRRVGLPL